MHNVGRRWCFTYNGYTDAYFHSLQDKLAQLSTYCIIGKEISPTGTRHLRGYVIFNQEVRFITVKNIIGNKADIEFARGSPKQNYKYYSKDKSFWEHGSIMNLRRGAPSGDDVSELDLFTMEFHDCLKNGRSFGTLREKYPRLAYQHMTEWLKSHHIISADEAKNRGPVRVAWLYGAPGTGKSTFAHTLFPNAYIKDPSNYWWDGYRHQKEVILQNFGRNHASLTNLTNWFSRSRFQVQMKYGYTSLEATKFIITSIYKPEQMFFMEELECMRKKVKFFDMANGTACIEQFFDDLTSQRIDMGSLNIRPNEVSQTFSSSFKIE